MSGAIDLNNDCGTRFKFEEPFKKHSIKMVSVTALSNTVVGVTVLSGMI